MTKMKPITWSESEALAIRALLRDDTHKAAVQAILFTACGIRDLCFHGEGDGGHWETAFHLGRRAAGLAIAQLAEEEIGQRLANKMKNEATEARK